MPSILDVSFDAFILVFSVIFDFYYHCFIVCMSVLCLHFLCNFVLCAASCAINDDDDDDNVSLLQSVSTP